MGKKTALAFGRVIDKIKLPEEFHRGKKLMEKDKIEIRRLYKKEKFSYRELAEMFDVAFGTIQCVINEERRLANLVLAKKWRDKNRQAIREKAKGKVMELRYYKKALILEDKIKI